MRKDRKNRGAIICLICGFNDQNRSKLKEHYCLQHFRIELKSLNAGNTRDCLFCGNTFINSTNTIRHVGTVHNKLLDVAKERYPEKFDAIKSQIKTNYKVKKVMEDGRAVIFAKTEKSSKKENAELNSVMKSSKKQGNEELVGLTCSECNKSISPQLSFRR